MNSSSDKEPFTEVNLAEIRMKKAPKRLVHFSDGVLEEYSSEDEVETDSKESMPLVDPKSLSWVPYFGYLVWMMGTRTLAVCDYLGEHLAWLLGITSPKFQYELDQFERMMKEEEDLQKHIKAENAGWCSMDSEGDRPSTIKMQPQSKESLKNSNIQV